MEGERVNGGKDVLMRKAGRKEGRKDSKGRQGSRVKREVREERRWATRLEVGGKSRSLPVPQSACLHSRSPWTHHGLRRIANSTRKKLGKNKKEKRKKR